MNRQLTRNFCFTRNNYTNTSLEDDLTCQYIIYGKEVGESGTPHLQGFVRFNTDKSIKSASKSLPGCHLEPAMATQAAIEYCKKEGDFTERGKRPMTPKEKGKKTQEYWHGIRKAAEDGRDEDIPEEIRYRDLRLIKAHRENALRSRALMDTDTQHEWYYGGTGTGKSRKAREDNPVFYTKNCNKWWCGYQDQDVVLLEDIDKKHECLGYFLKIWADRYPFLAENKGGSIMIRPKKIIVTSNYHPSEIFEDPGIIEPILRRFNCTEFKKLANT